MNFGGAGDGLAAALVTGVFSIVLFWLTQRKKTRDLAEAWAKQADLLHQELKGQYEQRIAYLEGSVASKDISLQRQQDALMKQAAMLLGERSHEEPVHPLATRRSEDNDDSHSD